MNSKKLLRHPQRKLALSYALMMGLLYIFIGFDVYYFTHQHYDRTLAEEITFIANTVHNQIEPKLSMPDRLDPSIQETLPDLCITPTCQSKKINQYHNTNTFAATDRYYLILTDKNNKIRATAGQAPTIKSASMLDPDREWTTWQDSAGKTYRQYATAIHGQTADSSLPHWGKLYIGRNIEDMSRLMQSMQTGLFLGFPLVLLAIGCASWYLAIRAMQPLYRAYEQQQNFSANVAHELRTPLAIHQLQLDQYLTQFQQHPEFTTALTDLRSQNRRLASIVTDLLLLAQLERTQAVQSAPNFCYLDEVVEDVVEELGILHSGHRIALDIPKQIQPVEVMGDRERIMRLVYNLLENALNYTPSGGQVAISIASNQQCHILKIQDNGVGIAAAELGHIFDRFHRTSTTQHTGGTGLGLGMVQAIANLYGAKIHVTSAIDHGSTFTVEFPRQPVGKRFSVSAFWVATSRRGHSAE
jgi:signal transduction histidine kinase